MPFSSGRIAVEGPTAGANESIAAARSKALQLTSTRSNGALMASAATVGGGGRARSPFLLLTTRPVFASSAARRARTRKVTSRPAASSRAPK